MVSTQDLIRHIELRLGDRNASKRAREQVYATVTNAMRRGSLPHLISVEALRQIAGLTLGSMYLGLGVNLDRLAWLRSRLNVNRTRPAPSRVLLPATAVPLPARIADLKPPYRTMPLRQLVSRWIRQPIWNLARWRRQACLYAQVGLRDGMSYPAIPPGAFVQIDPRLTAVQGLDRHYYFVRHPFGYSCCRCAVERGTIFLLPSPAALYPQLKFPHPGVVHIYGRVRAFCGRIDQVVPPPEITSRQLERRREPMEQTPAALAESSPGGRALLLNQRRCLGIPYDELDHATELLHSLSPEFARFHISNGHAHKIEHLEDFVPTISTLYPLVAYYALDFVDVVRAYGIEIDDSRMLDLSAKDTNLTAGEVAMSVGAFPSENEFASFVLNHWLEWPPLLSQVGPDLPAGRIFFFGGNRGIEPLVKAGSFLVVDDSQTTVPAEVEHRSVSSRADWERPLYLFYLREEGFVAGYAVRDGRRVHIVPHPQAADQRQVSLDDGDQGEVIGRITAVAALL
jgi:hypothetical protein